MPIRVVVLFNFGPLFGGFRFATRPGMFGLDDPLAFAVLERSVESAFTLLSAHDPADWAEVTPTGFDVAIPRLEGREGYIDGLGDGCISGVGEIILRACLPFQGWPLGGWVVYEGRHRAPDGTWTSFTAEELAEVW
jgi:hypothetical protein